MPCCWECSYTPDNWCDLWAGLTAYGLVSARSPALPLDIELHLPPTQCPLSRWTWVCQFPSVSFLHLFYKITFWDNWHEWCQSGAGYFYWELPMAALNVIAHVFFVL